MRKKTGKDADRRGERSDAPISFIVRIARDDTGQVRGVVERVKTGAKERFDGVEAISPLIARMVQVDK